MKGFHAFALRLLLLSAISLTLLSACDKEPEAPEVVMQKAKAAITAVESGEVEFSVTAIGNNGTDDLQFSGEAELTFDKRDEADQKMDLHVDASGAMKAGENYLDGAIDFDFVTVDKEYYVRLNQFETNDKTLEPMQPFIALYSDKWLRIAEDFIPPNIRELQGQDEAALLKKKQLEELFKETTLFNVTKEYGIEKLNGQKVYHYGLTPNLEGFKDYVTRAAIIDGREMTMQEVEEAVQVLAYIKGAELYIDVEDYYILKSVFVFSGEALSEGDAHLTLELIIEGSDFNEVMNIEPPSSSEDFNPLNLLVGFGTTTELDNSVEEGENEPEESVEEAVEESSEIMTEDTSEEEVVAEE